MKWMTAVLAAAVIPLAACTSSPADTAIVKGQTATIKVTCF